MGTDVTILHAYGIVVPKKFLDALITAWVLKTYGPEPARIRAKRARDLEQQQQKDERGERDQSEMMHKFLGKREYERLKVAEMKIPATTADSIPKDESAMMTDGEEEEEDDDDDWIEKLTPADYEDWYSDLQEYEHDELFDNYSIEGTLRFASHSSYNGMDKQDCYFIYYQPGGYKTVILGDYKIGGSTIGLCSPAEWGTLNTGLIGGATMPSAMATHYLGDIERNEESKEAYAELATDLKAHTHPVLEFIGGEMETNEELKNQFSKWIFWYLS